MSTNIFCLINILFVFENTHKIKNILGPNQLIRIIVSFYKMINIKKLYVGNGNNDNREILSD